MVGIANLAQSQWTGTQEGRNICHISSAIPDAQRVKGIYVLAKPIIEQSRQGQTWSSGRPNSSPALSPIAWFLPVATGCDAFAPAWASIPIRQRWQAVPTICAGSRWTAEADGSTGLGPHDGRAAGAVCSHGVPVGDGIA